MIAVVFVTILEFLTFIQFLEKIYIQHQADVNNYNLFYIVLFKVLKDTSLVKKQTVESYIYYIYIPIVPDMSVVT